MFSRGLQDKAENLLEAYRRRGWMLAAAESCTGGLVLGCLTEIAGSSDVVERGFVTYTNAAKREVLGVPGDLIDEVGAVSAEVARAMAEGALARSKADAAVSVTGVAGPGGGSVQKPVGLVFFGCVRHGAPAWSVERRFDGGRSRIRLASVDAALDLLADAAR